MLFSVSKSKFSTLILSNTLNAIEFLNFKLELTHEAGDSLHHQGSCTGEALAHG